MAERPVFDFGPFRVDIREKRLLRGGTVVPLTPKAFDMLAVLLDNRGRLVTKEELLAQIWGDTFVEDSNLTFHISMLRKALGQRDREGERYIETVPRRGYRFTAALDTAIPRPPARPNVGRSCERAELTRAFERARQRPGQLLCVTGEPGIGKTTLVETFLDAAAAADPACRTGRGRCSDRLEGTGAYLPMLDALESLCNGPSAVQIQRALEASAPSWHAQIVPHTGASAPSQERLKRELAGFFQDLTRTSPVVLFFDDLQWADTSTVDLLAYLAARFDTMRMLIVGAYRSSELLLARHPFVTLKLDLQGRGRCRELALEFLTRADVDEYLALEFANHRFPGAFADVIYGKTEGNPLFMVDLLRYLRDRGVIAVQGEEWVLAQSLPALEPHLPESIRSVIQRTIERLDPIDRRLLTAASVQGYEFLATVVAEAAGMAVTDAEDRLDVLDRVHGLVRRSRDQELPDGTCGVRYRFVHVLYHDALYGSLMPGRKAALSAAVASALQARYGDRQGEMASELALLLAAARDFPHAAAAFLAAAQQAMRVFASHEATALARRGLAVLDSVPGGADRDSLELLLQTALGLSTMSVQGFAAPEVERAYRRALTLCQTSGDRVQLFPILSGLWLYYIIRADLQTAHDLATQLVRLADADGGPMLVVHAHQAMAGTLMDLGRLRAALEHVERAAAVYEREPQERPDLFPLHAGVVIPVVAARVLWPLGYPDRALSHIDTALARGRECGQPQALTFALTFAMIVCHFRGDVDRTLEHAEESAAVSREHGLIQTVAWARLWRGWALVQHGRGEEGIAEMREGLGAYRALGSEIARPQFLALIAEALGAQGLVDEGLALLAEALATVEATGERYYEPEIHRLRGRLLVMQSPGAAPEGERSIRRALEMARRQGARGWELRAAIELCTLPVTGPLARGARAGLQDVLRWFTEGLETQDLRTARDLVGGTGAGV